MSSETEPTKRFSNLISGVITTITFILVLVYFGSLTFLYRHRRPFKNKAGLQLHRYGPVFYAFLVCGSLIEVAIASWLLLQYRHNNNTPNSGTKNGVRLILFSACWTAVTASLYTAFFLHPDWYQHPIASIGTQGTWVLVTWIFWILGTSLLNTALPSVFVGGTCATVVYCRAMQTLFGFSVLQIFALTIGVLTAALLAWQSTREIMRPKLLP